MILRRAQNEGGREAPSSALPGISPTRGEIGNSRVVRRAVAIDSERVVAMARAYHAAGASPFPFDEVHAARTFSKLQRDVMSIVLVTGEPGAANGMLAASVIVSPVTPQPLATEHIFWVDPDARGRAATALLDEYERWAVHMGCRALGLAEMGDVRVRRLYERRGFAPSETTWLKLL